MRPPGIATVSRRPALSGVRTMLTPSGGFQCGACGRGRGSLDASTRTCSPALRAARARSPPNHARLRLRVIGGDGPCRLGARVKLRRRWPRGVGVARLNTAAGYQADDTTARRVPRATVTPCGQATPFSTRRSSCLTTNAHCSRFALPKVWPARPTPSRKPPGQGESLGESSAFVRERSSRVRCRGVGSCPRRGVRTPCLMSSKPHRAKWRTRRHDMKGGARAMETAFSRSCREPSTPSTAFRCSGALGCSKAYRRGVRRVVLRAFPYSIVYVTEPRSIVIALVHASMSPVYWIDRLDEAK